MTGHPMSDAALLRCDCGSKTFLRFGPYPLPGEPDDGLRVIYTCSACGDQLRVYQGSKMRTDGPA